VFKPSNVSEEIEDLLARMRTESYAAKGVRFSHEGARIQEVQKGAVSNLHNRRKTLPEWEVRF